MSEWVVKKQNQDSVSSQVIIQLCIQIVVMMSGNKIELVIKQMK